MKITINCLVFITLISICSSCKKKKSSPSEYLTAVTIHDDSKSLPDSADTLEDLRRIDDSITVAIQPIILDSVKYYVVEGDMLLKEREYIAYLKSLQSRMTKSHFNEDFRAKSVIGIDEAGDTIKWPKDSVLRYSIIRNSFKNIPKGYETIVEVFNKAIKNWQNVCGIKFYHDQSQDNNALDFPTQGKNLTFIIVGENLFGEHLAYAFFPNEHKPRKKLRIDPRYFNTKHDKVGLITHEIGHIIGFYHEPVSPERIHLCPEEIVSSTKKTQIGPLNSESVMQMFCKDAYLDADKLKIKETDIHAAQHIYGAPESLFYSIKSFISN